MVADLQVHIMQLVCVDQFNEPERLTEVITNSLATLLCLYENKSYTLH